MYARHDEFSTQALSGELSALSRTRHSRPMMKPRVASRQATGLTSTAARRGSVLVLVIGVLAMLFIMGATQLMVARYERKMVEEKGKNTEAKDVVASAIVPAATSSNEDLAGMNAVAYDGGWNTGDTSILQDAADFTGWANNTNYTPGQILARSGDLLTGSLEPYYDEDPTAQVWTYYFMSWSRDAMVDLNGNGALDANEIPGTLNIVRNASPLVGGSPTNSSYVDSWAGRCVDADGDGVVDSRRIGTINGCDLYQRIIVHGGMVAVDRMTHPALLAQVIHPKDTSFSQQPWMLFDLNNTNRWNGTPDATTSDYESYRTKDEWRLRRRFMLAGSLIYNSNDWRALPRGDLRTLLPYTLGYLSPDSTFDSYVSHYWRTGSPPSTRTDITTSGERLWFDARMKPGKAPSEATPAENQANMYDRQHLLTTHSSDDLLRSVRDENGMLNNTIANSFYYVLNPTATPGTDAAHSLDTWARAGTVNIPISYGVTDGSGAWALEFNKPGLRTPFSLRDVLVAPATAGGYQASYRRAVQLTAYYLAMLQHQVNTSATPGVIASLPGQDVLLRRAAQLAVNTIDFADNNDLDVDGVQDANEVDPPTHFQFTAGGTLIDVFGVEKQPYITEVYAKVAAVYDSTTPTPIKDEAASDNASVFAVELYNPYQTAIDLTGLFLRSNDVDYSLATALATARSNTFMAAGEVLIFANTKTDPTASAALNPPFDNNHNHVILTPGLKIVQGLPVQLLQTQAVLLGLPDATYANGTATLETLVTAGASAVILDQIDLSDAGTYNLYESQNANVVSRVGTTMTLAATNFALPLIVPAPAAGTTYWRHTSLQRRKEPVPSHPIYWHFSVGKQAGFESGNLSTSAAEELPVHGLYVDNSTAWGYLKENDLAQGDVTTAPLALNALRFQNLPPFAMLTSDRGLDLTTSNLTTPPLYVGTAAFPTTGSLLLVTSQGPRCYDGVATSDPVGNPTAPPICMPIKMGADLTIPAGQLGNDVALTGYMYGKRLDIGHMPVFDIRQNLSLGSPAQSQLTVDVTSDLAETQGRMDVPWGQMVFNYFTALPLEELTSARYAAATNLVQFQDLYIDDFGYTNGTNPLYSYCPFVEPVTEASARYGPRVRGRININYAPWWVMDGLPALRGDHVPGVAEQPVAGVPVLEMLADPSTTNLLDPQGVASNTSAAGIEFMSLLFESTSNVAGAADRTISPVLARYLQAFRERRPVDGYSLTYPDQPGFTTTGAICDVIARIPVIFKYSGVNLGSGSAIPFVLVRAYPDPTVLTGSQTTATLRPFSYLGYLQMIAPIVRLEDWATTKSHVYTVYNLVGDGQGTWLRSQTTFDRTRCLYTNDLPDKITQTEPMSYFNAVNDQQ